MGVGCKILLSPYLKFASFNTSQYLPNNELFSLLFVCVIFVVEKAFAKPFLMAEKKWVLFCFRGC